MCRYITQDFNLTRLSEVGRGEGCLNRSSGSELNERLLICISWKKVLYFLDELQCNYVIYSKVFLRLNSSFSWNIRTERIKNIKTSFETRSIARKRKKCQLFLQRVYHILLDCDILMILLCIKQGI